MKVCESVCVGFSWIAAKSEMQKSLKKERWRSSSNATATTATATTAEAATATSLTLKSVSMVFFSWGSLMSRFMDGSKELKLPEIKVDNK